MWSRQFPAGGRTLHRVWLVVAEQGKDAEGDVRLAHADLVGEIGDTPLAEDVVECDGPLELLA